MTNPIAKTAQRTWQRLGVIAAGATAVVGLAIVRLLSFHAHPVP